TCNRPKGVFEDSKQYFSGKHWSYGVKTESAHYPNGQVVAISRHHPGSVSDFTIFTQNVDRYKELVKKTPAEMTIPDHGTLRSRYPDQWGILADRGYQGAGSIMRAYTP